MSRRYCIVCGIVALLMVTGCEDGDGPSGTGSNRTTVNNASPSNNTTSSSNNTATANNDTNSGDSDVFLSSPSLAPQSNENAVGEFALTDTSIRDGSDSSEPSIYLGSITGGGEGSSAFGTNFGSIISSIEHTHVFAMDDTRVPSAHPIANPEPVTALLSLMGLAVLGMTTRRRTM